MEIAEIMSEPEAGERLAALETEMRLISETLTRMAKTLEVQSEQGVRIEQLQKVAAAFDTDFDLQRREFAALRMDFESFKTYVRVRDWALAGGATIGASVGAYLLNLILPSIL